MQWGKMMKLFTNHLVYITQFFSLLLIGSIFFLLGIEKTSRISSFLVRKVGSRLKHHKIVVDNITRCFPDLSAEEIHHMAIGAWNNLGAIAGESLFLKTLNRKKLDERLVVEDSANAMAPGARVFVIPHMANFEFIAGLPERINLPSHFLYAKQRNPYVNQLIYLFRKKPLVHAHQSRSVSGLKGLTQALDKGEAIVLLGDQRAKGCMATFFSHPVQSSTLAAKFTLKYGCPLYLLKLHRTGIARYHLDTESIPVHPDDDVASLTQRINDAMEAWIRCHPEQWFWMHNRFKLP